MILIANDCEKDIKRLYPIAQKWVWFTTDFEKFYKTEITINKKENPFIVNYKILDLKKKIVFEDFITIPITVENKRNFRIPAIVGIVSFFTGVVIGIIITIKVEKST